MSLRNPYQTYQQNAVTTATPAELTLKLYNGCLKFTKLAKIAIENKEIEERHTNIVKAQEIINYLIDTLDEKEEISQSMASLYEFIKSQLVTANIKNDDKPLEEVIELVTEFRDTWKQAMQSK
jgi:flagellar secretion chaperone FliS